MSDTIVVFTRKTIEQIVNTRGVSAVHATGKRPEDDLFGLRKKRARSQRPGTAWSRFSDWAHRRHCVRSGRG